MAERSVTDMRTKMTTMRGEMVADEKSTFDITAEMGRQYKAMQESMLGKITSLEQNILSLKDDLGKGFAWLVWAMQRMQRKADGCAAESLDCFSSPYFLQSNAVFFRLQQCQDQDLQRSCERKTKS